MTIKLKFVRRRSAEQKLGALIGLCNQTVSQPVGQYVIFPHICKKISCNYES